jgi:hypothetical protein
MIPVAARVAPIDLKEISAWTFFNPTRLPNISAQKNGLREQVERIMNMAQVRSPEEAAEKRADGGRRRKHKR